MIFRFRSIVLHLILSLTLFSNKFNSLSFRLSKFMKILKRFLWIWVSRAFTFDFILINALCFIAVRRASSPVTIYFSFLLYKEWYITILLFFFMYSLIIVCFFRFGARWYFALLSIIFIFFVSANMVVDDISHIIIYIIVYYCNITTTNVAGMSYLLFVFATRNRRLIVAVPAVSYLYRFVWSLLIVFALCEILHSLKTMMNNKFRICL